MPSNPVTSARESTSLSSRVLDSLTASVAVVDHRGTIVATNEAWTHFALDNRGDPDAVGVGANYLDVCRRAMGGNDRLYAERAWQGIKDVLEGKREVFTLEYPCHSPTHQRWFLLHVSPLKDDPSRVVTVHLSITDRKLVENALVESERLAAIGQAMKGLSHKGRNSLQHAQGFIDLLRCSVEDDAEAAELLDRVEGAQRRLISLYEEVQRYAAPINLRCSRTRLDELAAMVWEQIPSRSAESKFTQVVPDFDLGCELDTGMIAQLLKSVFDNALTTDPPSTLIELSYQQSVLGDQPAITIIISDNGPGVSNTDREIVFEPFYTSKTIGTGLGLSMAHRITKAHGGKLSMGKPKRGGASVYLTLPIDQHCASADRSI